MSRTRLRTVRDALDRGEDLAPADRTWLADAADRALAGERSVAKAFGLQLSPEDRAEAVRQRAALVHELAGFFIAEYPTSRAINMAAAARAYADLQWPQTRHLYEMPADHVCTANGILWRLSRLADETDQRWPVEWRQMLTLLQNF